MSKAPRLRSLASQAIVARPTTSSSASACSSTSSSLSSLGSPAPSDPKATKGANDDVLSILFSSDSSNSSDDEVLLKEGVGLKKRKGGKKTGEDKDDKYDKMDRAAKWLLVLGKDGATKEEGEGIDMHGLD